MQKPVVSVIGLGKLGLPLAGLLAATGFDTIGVDCDERVIADLDYTAGTRCEPGLAGLLRGKAQRLLTTANLAWAVQSSNATFVIVPTPSLPGGAFDTVLVEKVVSQIGAALRGKDRYHLVVIVSTVMPGTMVERILPALETAAGRKLGDALGLCYMPEFVALGSVLDDMRHPDLALIGEASTADGDRLLAIMEALWEQTPTITRMNFVNAELAKIAINTMVTAKISFANQIAELCEKLPGGNAFDVVRAIGADRRIGTAYLKPALGFGGPCFPRDNAALIALGRALDVATELPEATQQVNQRQVDRIIARASSLARPGSTVAVLGLAYKAGTDVCEASQGCAIANNLAERGFRVVVFDPAAMVSAASQLAPAIERAHDADSAIAQADLVILATPWPQFADLPRTAFLPAGRRLVVIDCWQQLPRDGWQADVDVHVPGTSMLAMLETPHAVI